MAINAQNRKVSDSTRNKASSMSRGDGSLRKSRERRLNGSSSSQARLTPARIPTPNETERGNYTQSSKTKAVEQVQAMPNKYLVSVEMLVEGYINSFLDFFYFTHRAAPDTSDGNTVGESEEGTKESFDPDALQFLKAQLTTAEEADRSSDSTTSFQSYQQLASFFEVRKDYEKSVYFREKCYDAAKRAGVRKLEAEASRMLGVSWEKAGNSAKAVQYLEEYRALVEKDDANETSVAQHELVQAYLLRASELEQEQRYEDAVHFYRQCLDAARTGGDKDSVGRVSYKLGSALQELGKTEDAIRHYEESLEIGVLVSDEDAQARACAALAYAYQKSGSMDKAIEYLKRNLDLATNTTNLRAQCDACKTLGLILIREKLFTKALQYFEKQFEIALSIGDRDLIENARMNLGFARGQARLKRHVQLVLHDLPALLHWRHTHSDAADSGTTGS